MSSCSSCHWIVARLTTTKRGAGSVAAWPPPVCPRLCKTSYWRSCQAQPTLCFKVLPQLAYSIYQAWPSAAHSAATSSSSLWTFFSTPSQRPAGVVGLSAFADDWTVCCKGLLALFRLLPMLQVFEAASGQQLNIPKSGIIPSRTLTAAEALCCRIYWGQIQILYRARILAVDRNVGQPPRPVPHAPRKVFTSFTGVLSHPPANVTSYACGDCKCLFCFLILFR